MVDSRRATAAGTFYASDSSVLTADLARMLDDVAPLPAGAQAPKAIIVPHAGYRYSGVVAAQAYARLRPSRDRIKRVVLMGPAHYGAFAGIALSSAKQFETPLGPVAVDQDAHQEALRLSRVIVDDAPHEFEHSLEIQLPFIRESLGAAAIVPLLVGRASGAQAAEVLARLWGGAETVIVISSDLSHDRDPESAREIDQSTAEMIEALDGSRLTADRVCGFQAIHGLLIEARRRGLGIERLALRNSGDAGVDTSTVVGYGSWALGD